MRKAIALILCILLILSLGSCQYLGGTPIASHTGDFVLPAGSSLPSADAGAPALTVPTSVPSGYTFRKTNWGMKREDVILSEGRQPDEISGDRISYTKKTVLNRQCDLFYIFSADKLVSGGYDFTEDDPDTCANDYKDIIASLTKDSVSPATTQTLWSNGEFKNDPQKYGLAVLLGDLSYQTMWNEGESSVLCELHASASGGARKALVTATWQSPDQPAPALSASPSATAAAPTQTATGAAAGSASAAPESSESTVSTLPSQSPAESIEPMPVSSEFPSASPSEASGFAFRNTNWGMAKDAVIASEGKKPGKSSDDTITYADETFQGRDCSLFYAFDRDTLQTGGYDIRENQKHGIADYNDMVSVLTKQYGSPAVSEQLWSNTRRQGDPANLSLAVASGDVVLRSVWYTDHATIGCVLYGYGKGSQRKTVLTVSFQNPAAAAPDIETPPGYSFRKTNWDMSMDQVVASEGRQPDEKGVDYLIYKKEKYHNADCHIIYQFANGSLSSGSYMIYSMHTDPNDYIKDYNTAVAILHQSYGAPAASNQTWNNPLSRYKNDAQNYGLAVLRGDLSLSSQWVLGQAAINCSITLANTIVAIDITYKQPA